MALLSGRLAAKASIQEREVARLTLPHKQDIVRLASLGDDSYSFSISWPRVVPFGAAGSPINQEAIDHYDDVINTILEYGMKPVVTLQYFDTPQYFAGNSLT